MNRHPAGMVCAGLAWLLTVVLVVALGLSALPAFTLCMSALVVFGVWSAGAERRERSRRDE